MANDDSSKGPDAPAPPRLHEPPAHERPEWKATVAMFERALGSLRPGESARFTVTIRRDQDS